ncbi:MAG: hypothetical protein P1V29_01490 [Gammaproteobacteria bacterium]|nr:hypothetical protein [Gammaproteobacteria bacterium]
MGSKSTSNQLLLRVSAVAVLCLIAFSAAGLASRWRAQQAATQQAIHVASEIFVYERTSSLMLYAHPDLFTHRRELDWPTYLANAKRRLGGLTAIDTIEGAVTGAGLLRNSNSATAAYTVFARFASGPAELEIELIESQEGWLVTRFRILAQALNQ